MNKKIFFGKNDLRFYYYRYKDSNIYSLSVLLVTIIICLILIFQIIIPQAQIYFSIRKETEDLGSKIKVINDNIDFVNSLDKSELNSQLQIATKAIPSDKDFAGIINAISDAAVRSGVSISDFSFRLDESQGVASPGLKVAHIGLVPIKIIFDINGSNDGGKKFLTEISEKIPLVEVVSVNGDSNTLSVNLNFFYKPLPNLTFKEDNPISSLSPAKQDLIKKLSTWQSSSSNQDLAPVGTSSATPLF